ncbi:MAG: hypothetical protein V7745_01495 [Pseudomonadales bacterium]
MKMFERYPFGKLTFILFSGLLASTTATAQSPGKLHWHGFFNQGVIYTDENNFFGDSTDTSFDFRSVGLGVSWQPLDKLLFSVQGLYRDAGKTSTNGVNVDYAVINYNLVNQLGFGLSVRAGRVKNPYGLYNETRDVAATRPSVLLPQSIYPAAFRDIFHTSDSVILSGYKEAANWLINFDFLRGSVPFDERSERLLIPVSQPANIEGDKLWGARSLFEYDGGLMRFGLTYIKFEGRIDTTPLVIFPGDMDIDSYVLSFEYNWECFQFTTEYRQTDFIYENVIAPGLSSQRTSEAYYFQLSWQVDEKLRLFSRYEDYYPNRDDKSGRGQLKFGRPKSDGFSNSVVVGAQYQLAEDWLLAGEVHQVKGTATLPVVENLAASKVKEKWNLYTLQLSYKF